MRPQRVKHSCTWTLGRTRPGAAGPRLPSSHPAMRDTCARCLERSRGAPSWTEVEKTSASRGTRGGSRQAPRQDSARRLPPPTTDRGGEGYSVRMPESAGGHRVRRRQPVTSTISRSRCAPQDTSGDQQRRVAPGRTHPADRREARSTASTASETESPGTVPPAIVYTTVPTATTPRP